MKAKQTALFSKHSNAKNTFQHSPSDPKFRTFTYIPTTYVVFFLHHFRNMTHTLWTGYSVINCYIYGILSSTKNPRIQLIFFCFFYALERFKQPRGIRYIFLTTFKFLPFTSFLSVMEKTMFVIQYMTKYWL